MSKLPVFEHFLSVGKSQVETQVVFQAKTQAKKFLLNWVPGDEADDARPVDALGQDEGVVRRREDDQRLDDADVLRELEYEGRHGAHRHADDEAAEDHGEETEEREESMMQPIHSSAH